MKIFTGNQIKELDAATIRSEPVSSADLMERASFGLFEWIMQHFDRSKKILIFCGPGNNGGDGLVLARLLDNNRYPCKVFYIDQGVETSADWKINRERLLSETDVEVVNIESPVDFPLTGPDDIIVDSIFGSGLTRPVQGLYADTVSLINKSGNIVIAVDIPTGLFTEGIGNKQGSVIEADHTLSFQFPKLAFMFPENEVYTGQWHVLPIGIHKPAIDDMSTPYELIDYGLIRPMLRPRRRFAHKGDFGHGLLIGGSYGKMGAVVLGARAALRSGIGLITCHIPAGGNQVLQTAIPEAMTSVDPSEKHISAAVNTDNYSAIAIGPGLGMSMATNNAFDGLLRKCRKLPLVIDADGLNIIAANKDMYAMIPPGSVLTPHPREFERLAGRAEESPGRLKLQIEFSRKYKCVIVQKGANTSITSPDGQVWFNSTGNPGMSTAGSGDVLTGIILSLLSQGYDPLNASLTGVFLHGLAGDLAAIELGQESLTASDIVNHIGSAFRKIKEL